MLIPSNRMQYKATQKAQVNERNAAESKRRLTSYIFHEVRVPLNSALLAVQNMAAAGIFRKSHELEFTALEGSLSMMSKVLNDMLDFNRLDAGKFENVVRPFSFHQVLRTLCVPLRMATDARGLELIVEMDPLIDQFARRATGESEDAIRSRPRDPGIMVGDEMRLRQVVNNLASNACKFTPTGGKITVRTKLVWPTSASITGPMPVRLPNGSQSQSHGRAHQHRPTPSVAHAQSRTPSRGGSADGKANGADAPLSDDALISHNAWHEGRPPLDRIIVRIEVHDTGVGIQSGDLAHSKLFCESLRHTISFAKPHPSPQRRLIRQNRAGYKAVKAPASVSRSCDKSSNAVVAVSVCTPQVLTKGRRFGSN